MAFSSRTKLQQIPRGSSKSSSPEAWLLSVLANKWVILALTTAAFAGVQVFWSNNNGAAVLNSAGGNASGGRQAQQLRAAAALAVVDDYDDEGTNVVDCADMLLRQQEDNLGFPDPNKGMELKEYSRWTEYKNRKDLYGNVNRPKSFGLAVHNQDFDYLRWKIMRVGNYYESHMEWIWRSLMKEYTTAQSSSSSSILATNAGATPVVRVLDVGGNIGYFSLVSLATASKTAAVAVDTFEPNPVNHLRMCESLRINRWIKNDTRRAKIHGVGLSDVGNQKMALMFPKGNPGQGSFYSLEEADSVTFKTGIDERFPKQVLPLITLDDFAEKRGWLAADASTRPLVAILKIDVEGMDHLVLRGASRLIRSNIARNVFVELQKHTDELRQQSAGSLRILLGAGYKVMAYGGWVGPEKPATDSMNVSVPSEDEHQMNAVIDNILNVQDIEGGAVNLWLSLEDSTLAAKIFSSSPAYSSSSSSS